MANLIKDNKLKVGDKFYDINGKTPELKGFGLGEVFHIYSDKDLFTVKFPQIELPYMFDETFNRWDKSGVLGAKRGYTEKELLTNWNPLKLNKYFDKEIITQIRDNNLSLLEGLNHDYFLEEITNNIESFPGMRETGGIKVFKDFIIAEYEDREFRIYNLAKKLKETTEEPFILYDYKGYIITSSKNIIKAIKKITKRKTEIVLGNDNLLLDQENIIVEENGEYIIKGL